MTDWYLFTSNEWVRISARAAERDRQKRGYESTRLWNEGSHFVGLLGEKVFGVLVGVEPDYGLRVAGDRGYDFGLGVTVDVKTATFWRDPHLKHTPEKREEWPDVFALVAIDLGLRRGRYIGYATSSEVAAAPLRNYGRGMQHHLKPHQLHHDLPTVMENA